MWLDQGKIMAFGEPDMVLDAYRKAMAATKELERPAKRPALRTAIVYGNCQAEALSNILKKDELFGSLFRVVYCHNYDAPGQDRNLPASEDLSACALLFSQHGPEPFAFADRLPKECLTVRFPSVDFNLLWPFHCINPYNKPQLPELPWGPFPYGDRIILDCIEKGMAPDDILEYYLNGWAQYKVDLKHITRLDQARLEDVYKRQGLLLEIRQQIVLPAAGSLRQRASAGWTSVCDVRAPLGFVRRGRRMLRRV